MKSRTTRMPRLGLAALALIATLTLTPQARALIEIKGGYTLLNVNSGDINDANSSFVLPKLDSLTGFHADVMAMLPLMPVGLGLRYESLSRKEAGTGGEFKADWTRISLAINSRLIDTLFYLGPIATIGISNDFKYTIAGTEFKTDNSLNASVGVEGGAKLGLFLAGAELGYMYAPLGDLKGASGSTITVNGHSAQADMSGVYFRIALGVGF